MRTHTIGTFAIGILASLVWASADFSSALAQAQTDSAQPATQESSPKPIGKVVTATGSVAIEHAGAVVVQANVSGEAGQVKVGDVVYLGDVVRTGADGRLGIAFADGTAFNLSSNARMALTEYVYDPNGKANSTLFNLTNGTFTFMAGKIAKSGDMKIDTPVATMGIRGTTPHVEVSDDGTVKFSTLIEEGKDKLGKRALGPVIKQPEQRADQKFNPKICRGC